MWEKKNLKDRQISNNIFFLKIILFIDKRPLFWPVDLKFYGTDCAQRTIWLLYYARNSLKNDKNEGETSSYE